MKPSLFNLLMRGGLSYRDMGEILGMKKSRIQWFVLELERRGWIVVRRRLVCLIDGRTSNAVNEYWRGKL